MVTFSEFCNAKTAVTKYDESNNSEEGNDDYAIQ
jgi:hypothetical protein